ncbi:MAG: DUF3187 family protein [Thermoanaerobaculia bacterium]
MPIRAAGRQAMERGYDSTAAFESAGRLVSRGPHAAPVFVVATLCLGLVRAAGGGDDMSPAGQASAPQARPPATAFALRSMHVLHLPLLDFGAAQPGTPSPGSFEWVLSTGYATTYSTTWHARRVHDDPARRGKPLSREEADYIHAAFPNDGVLFVDGESSRASLSGRYGLTRSLSVSVEVPYVGHGSNGVEQFVHGFHQAFGLEENGRDLFPRGHTTVMLQLPGGPLSLTDFHPDSGLGDVTATLSWRRPRFAGGWTLGLDAAVKAPTGSAADLNGSGGWDGGLLAFGVFEKGRWTLEADGSIVLPGKWRTPVPLDPSAFGRMVLSVIYAFGPRTRAGVSLTAAQSPYRDRSYSSLSEAGVELGLGAEHDFGPRFAVRLLFTEGLPSSGDRSDFGVMLGLRYR